MAEITSTVEAVIIHHKDGIPVAVTRTNGHHTLYKLDGAMKREEVENFYETNQTKAHGSE